MPRGRPHEGVLPETPHFLLHVPLHIVRPEIFIASDPPSTPTPPLRENKVVRLTPKNGWNELVPMIINGLRIEFAAHSCCCYDVVPCISRSADASQFLCRRVAYDVGQERPFYSPSVNVSARRLFPT